MHNLFDNRKSREMLRRIKLKQCTISETAKIVICINCAAISCNADFDRGHAISLLGLKEKDYTRQKELLESLLDLTKKISLDEMCAPLGISDVLKNDAAQLLNEHKKRYPFISGVENAHFLAMAIYQSCKLKGKKNGAIKSKLTQFSKLNGKSWKQLEDEWDKWIGEYLSSTNEPNSKSNGEPKSVQKGRIFLSNNFMQAFRNIAFISFLVGIDQMDQINSDGSVSQIEIQSQTYEEWRADQLKKAKAELQKKSFQ